MLDGKPMTMEEMEDFMSLNLFAEGRTEEEARELWNAYAKRWGLDDALIEAV